jgi:hypothetical protein
MLHRQISRAVGFVSVCLSTALAVAQSPHAPAAPVLEDPRTNWTVPEPEVASIDGRNLDWQWRFQAEALYLRRDNKSGNIPVIDGPETFRFGQFDFDYQYGTRLSLSLMEDDYEFEVTFLSMEDWSDQTAGTLIHALDFDGPAAFGAAALGSRLAVDPGNNPNFLTSGTYFAPLSSASNAATETDALDFMAPGAGFQARYTADFQDIEANYKQRAQPGRFLRWGLGFRNVKVRENGFAALSGTFGSVDADGIGVPGTAGLPSAPLTGAGLTFVTGGTDDGYSAGDNLLLSSRSRTENRLNGVQVIVDLQWLESDHFNLSSFGKVGVFHNEVTGSIDEQYNGTIGNTSSYSRSVSDSTSAVAFVGHTGLTGRVCLCRNVRLTAGYEAVYLAGLALAPDQVGAISTPVTGTSSLDLRTNGTIFLHGGSVGLEILFP